MQLDRILMVALVAAPLVGVALKAAVPNEFEPDRRDLLREAESALLRSGLKKSEQSRMLVSGEPVAVAYGRPGCEGLLVVAPLPRTAQGLKHVLGSLEGAFSEIGFVFKGEAHENYPLWQRLASNLEIALTRRSGVLSPFGEPLFAYGEVGSCELETKVDWRLLSLEAV